MALIDGHTFQLSMRNAAKRIASIPGVTRHSELLARFHWRAKLAETQRHFGDAPVFSYREELYSYVNEVFFDGGRGSMDFLEFGVFEGASLRAWSNLNRNSETRYWGFDSFEGLPEDWRPRLKKGSFSTAGHVPSIDDPRVTYVVGWFQQTLLPFLTRYEPRHPIVVH